MKKSQKKEKNDMDNEKTVADVFNTLTEEQKTVVYALIGQALEDNEKYDEKYDEEDDGRRNKENEA